MKHKTKYFVLLALVANICVIYKTINNRVFPMVNNIKNEEINSTNFALMIEQDDGSYIESKSSKWPENYKLNIEKSKCIDKNGIELNDILKTEKNLVKINTTTTSYCYLYFDITELSASEYLIKNISNEMLWDSTLEDDGYRYVGTNPDNYICFGTTNKEECTSNTDKYMYRIIGIFEGSDRKQHLKLIKKEALNTTYAWHSGASTDTDWDESDLYKGLNGTYFVSNNEYSYMQESIWYNKIVEWNYTATNTKTYENYIENNSYGLFYYDSTSKVVYLHEMNRNSKMSSVGMWTSIISKVGLMYASDYLLSLGVSALEYTSNNNETLKTGWMHLGNNDYISKGIEWTMTKMGYDGQYYYSYDIDYDGYVWYCVYDCDEWYVRPVFYLTSDITIGGEGTIDNPYIITN